MTTMNEYEVTYYLVENGIEHKDPFYTMTIFAYGTNEAMHKARKLVDDELEPEQREKYKMAWAPLDEYNFDRMVKKWHFKWCSHGER